MATKRLALVLFILVFTATCAQAQQGVQWHLNLEQATQLAAQTERLLLVHFWAPNCGPCVRLDREVFSKSTVSAALQANYVPVKINAYQSPSLAKHFGVTRWPTDVIVRPYGPVLAKFLSPVGADAYVTRMNQVASTSRTQPGAQIAQAGQSASPNNPYAGIAPSMGVSPNIQGSTPQGYQAPQPNPYQAPPSVQPHGYAAAPPNPYGPNAATQPNYSAQGPAPQDRYGQPQQTTMPANPYAAPTQPAAGGFANNPASDSNPVGDRYASGPAGPSAQGFDSRYATQPASPPPTPNVQSNPYINPPPANPPIAQNPTPQQPQPQPPQTTANPPVAGLPPGAPPVGLDGFCPVTLTEGQRWTRGDVKWGAIHRGRTYLFTGKAEQQRFLANPDIYSPVLAGNDPVLAIDQGQSVAGQRRHGVYFGNHVYLFSSEETLNRFSQNPDRYVNGVQQAMQQAAGQPPRR